MLVGITGWHRRDPWLIDVAEAKLNNIVYFVYTWLCILYRGNTWRQSGLGRGFVDYSENREHTEGRTHRGK